jgi:pimeloyl-ACP methyl ester carboxylesterase
MDGTGRLFEGLLRELPDAEVVSYPSDRPASYAELLRRLPLTGEPVNLVAESFSGPLGILAAASHHDVRALVLVASFARCPVGGVLRQVAGRVPAAVFRAVPPSWVLRRYLLGAQASEAEVASLRDVLRAVSPVVLADRLRQISQVDVLEAFAGLQVPVLYLGGREDRLVGADVPRALARARPATQVVTLAAPHLVLQRCPKEAGHALRAFFEGHELRSSSVSMASFDSPG